jgi:ubiquinol-cytochrome c reductase cytochrome c subunit
VRTTQVCLALAVVAVGTACASEVAPYRATIEPNRPALSGQELFLRDCAWCHGNDGGGTGRAPDIISGQNGPAFTDFMLSTGRMPIRSPDEDVRRTTPVYEQDEISALVDYVATLGGAGPGIPQPDPTAADLGKGLQLYQDNCSACHAPTLIGGALTAGSGPEARRPTAPELFESTPREIAEAMLIGPGAMPVFGPNTLDIEEVNAIVAYVVHQQSPEDLGGTPIGHVGPVTEGAVGWLLGLGALLLVARVIGTTSRR